MMSSKNLEFNIKLNDTPIEGVILQVYFHSIKYNNSYEVLTEKSNKEGLINLSFKDIIFQFDELKRKFPMDFNYSFTDADKIFDVKLFNINWYENLTSNGKKVRGVPSLNLQNISLKDYISYTLTSKNNDYNAQTQTFSLDDKSIDFKVTKK